MSLVVNEIKKITGISFFKKVLLVLLILNSFVIGINVYQDGLDDVRDNSQSYRAYLQQIDDNYTKMKGISLFTDQDSFSFKNLEKLKKDYDKSHDVIITEDASAAVGNVLDSKITDIIVFFLVLYVAVKMIFLEKDTGMQLVIMPTCNGRKKLISSKLKAISIIVMGITDIFYGSNIIIAGMIGDFGAPSRSIQSVFGYEKCCYDISVIQVMVLVMLSKIMIYLLIAVMTTLAAVCLDKLAFVYSCWILVITISFIEKIFIKSDSPYYILNQVNILTFIKADTYFSEYNNLNLFRTPVSSCNAFLILVPILLLVTLSITVKLFSVQENDLKERSFFMQIPWKRKTKILNNLFMQELYKILIYNKGLYIIFVMVISIAIFLPTKSNYVTSDEEVYYRLYLQRVGGKATEEKIEYLIDIQEQLEAYTFGEIDKASLSLVENTDLDTIAFQMAAIDRLIAHGEYLLEKGGNFLIDDGYVLATGGGTLEEKQGVLLLLLITLILITSNVICIEHDSGMHTLICACANGGQKMRKNKLAATFSVLSLAKLLADCIYYGNIFVAYGIRDIDAPACSMEHLEKIPMQISILMFILIIIVSEYIILSIYTAVILAVQKKIKNYINTILCALLICMIGIAIVLFISPPFYVPYS